MTSQRRPRAFVLDDPPEIPPVSKQVEKPALRPAPPIIAAPKPAAPQPVPVIEPAPEVVFVRPIIRPIERVSQSAQNIEIEFTQEPETSDEIVTLPETLSKQPHRMPWGGLLLSATASLITLWAGLSIVNLIESFFARSAFLGWLGFALAALAASALFAIVLREVWSIWRLKTIEDLQEKSARAINLDERQAADETLSGLVSLYASRHDMRWSLDKLKSHGSDIMDPSDRVKLADRILLEPLDEEATRIIARRAKRVTLITTVTPVASIDILFVAAQNLAMLREIATLYGGKPSAFATWRLGRMVLTHLAVTGGLALSENILHHIVGKGLLGRLSARFGEGAINGIMTSRVGLAAKAICRPITNEKGTAETLTGLLKSIISTNEKT
jgi:putative membrane protein